MSISSSLRWIPYSGGDDVLIVRIGASVLLGRGGIAGGFLEVALGGVVGGVAGGKKVGGRLSVTAFISFWLSCIPA